MIPIKSLVTTSGLLLACVASAHAEALSWEIDSGFSGVADSRFKGPSTHGDVKAADFGFRAVASAPTRGGPLVRAGFDWQRFNFVLPESALLPNTLQSLALVVGADFQAGEAWLFRLEAMPGLYAGNTDFRLESFNVPVILGGSYFVSADLQLIAGIEVDFNARYPVLGAVGLRWKFAPDFVLNAVLPNPRIEYNYGKALTFYAGGDIRTATYRVDSDFGRAHGLPRLGNSIIDYTQIRLGGGASWSVNSNLTLEMEAGVVPIQEFDFHRAGVNVKSDGTPAYGAISLKAKF